MIFHSIRWRLQAWHGLILVLVLSGFGLTAYHVARENQLRRVDQDLNQRLLALMNPGPRPGPPEGGPFGGPMESRFEGPPSRPFPERNGLAPDQPPDLPFANRFEGPGGPGRGRGRNPENFLLRIQTLVQQGGAVGQDETNTFYYILWQSDGTVLARSPGAPTSVPAPGNLVDAQAEPASEFDKGPPPDSGPAVPPEARTRGQVRELYRPLPRNHYVLIGRSLAPEIAAMQQLALWLTAAGGAVLLLGLAGGWWVATRAIRPIDDISATASKIAAGDLAQRIDAADTDSELGRLAGVLNSTFARLEAAFAQQAQFTSDASHELRTPVSVILTQTQTALSRPRTNEEYIQTLEACQRSARRMKALTESLLELARLDAGQEPMKREPIDLAAVAADAIDLVRPLATDRGIKLQGDLAPTPCQGDAQRLGQVITNLLSNAIYFNREHGEVRIAVRAEGGSAILTVADTGQGIPAEDLPNLFKRFFRADKSRSRVQGRNGLGLAICKSILDAHGGSIDVHSVAGEGTTFTVQLPLS